MQPPRVPVTRMLTKARELSKSGRPTQREEGGKQQKGRQPLLPHEILLFSRLSEPPRQQYPHRRVNKQHPVLPGPVRRWYSPAERVDGRGFRPQFLSDTPGFHSDNMAARRRSRQERCMTGRDERERAVHCANREGREGHTGPVPLLCECVVCLYCGLCL